MVRSLFSLFLALALTLLWGEYASAQPGGGPQNPRMMERLESLKKVRLIEALELKEEQAVRFVARHAEHEKRRKDLNSERDAALDRLEQVVRGKGNDREYEKAFAELAALEARMGEENRMFVAGLSDLLSPEQRARLLLFERKFQRELREAIRDTQRRRFPREKDKEE